MGLIPNQPGALPPPQAQQTPPALGDELLGAPRSSMSPLFPPTPNMTPAYPQGHIDPASRVTLTSGSEPSTPGSPLMGFRDQLREINRAAEEADRKRAGMAGGVVGAWKRARQATEEALGAEQLYQTTSAQAQRKSAEKEQVLRDELMRQTAKAREPVERKAGAYDAALRSYREIGSVDPGRVWKDSEGNKNTAKVIMAALAAGLGAFASGINGGPNYALDIINDAIARDIDAQRDAIGKARSDVDVAGLELSTARQMFDDERSQLLAAHTLKLDGVRQALAVRLEEMRAPAMRAAGKKVLAEMDAQIEQNKATIMGQELDRQHGRRMQAFGADLQLAEAEAKLLGEGAPEVAGVVWTGRRPPSKEDVNKAKEISGEYYAARRTLEQAIDMIQRGGLWGEGQGSQSPDPEELRQTLIASLAKLGYSDKQISSLVPDDLAHFWTQDTEGLGKLKSLLKSLGGRTQDLLAPHNATLNLQDAPGAQQGEALQQELKARGRKLGP